VEPEDDETETEETESYAPVDDRPHGPSLRRLLALVLISLVGVALLAAIVWTVSAWSEETEARTDDRTRPAGAPRRRDRARSSAAFTTVRCPVGRALDGWDGLRVEQLVREGETRRLAPIPFEIAGTDLVLQHADPEGVAALHWGRHRNRGRAVFEWETVGSSVRCFFQEPLPSPRNAPILGHVNGAELLPEGAVTLEGCNATQSDPVGVDGSFFLATTGEGCRLRAWRSSGVLRVPGPWVAVSPEPGREVEVVLTVPTWEPAGLGVNIRPEPDGMRITIVHENTPAENAGLVAGDLILSVDGVSTQGMDLDTFLQHGLGPEGSDVELVVLDVEGQTDVVVIHRAVLTIEP
jgi:hypothetical protein